MKKNSKKIRNYRRLKRRAKRLRKQPAFIQFLFYKILPFAFIRIILNNIFKRYYLIPLFIFFLSFFYKAGSQFSNEKLRESQLELLKTKEELKQLQLLNNKQYLTITNLKKEILEWNKKHNQLSLISEQKSEKLKSKNKRINQLNETIEQLEINNEDLYETNNELELEWNSLKQRVIEIQRQFENQSLAQKTLISQLQIKIAAKDSELKSKQFEIVNLKEQLKNQEAEFATDVKHIKEKLKEIELDITETKKRDKFQLIYILIDKFLRKK